MTYFQLISALSVTITLMVLESLGFDFIIIPIKEREYLYYYTVLIWKPSVTYKK